MRYASRAVILTSSVVKGWLDTMAERQLLEACQAELMWNTLLKQSPESEGAESHAGVISSMLGDLFEDMEGSRGLQTNAAKVIVDLKNAEESLRDLHAAYIIQLQSCQEMSSGIEKCAELAVKRLTMFESSVSQMRRSLLQTSVEPDSPSSTASSGGNEDLDSAAVARTSIVDNLAKDLCDRPMKLLQDIAQDIVASHRASGMTELPCMANVADALASVEDASKPVMERHQSLAEVARSRSEKCEVVTSALQSQRQQRRRSVLHDLMQGLGEPLTAPPACGQRRHSHTPVSQVDPSTSDLCRKAAQRPSLPASLRLCQDGWTGAMEANDRFAEVEMVEQCAGTCFAEEQEVVAKGLEEEVAAETPSVAGEASGDMGAETRWHKDFAHAQQRLDDSPQRAANLQISCSRVGSTATGEQFRRPSASPLAGGGSWQARPSSRGNSKPMPPQGTWQTRPDSRGKKKTMPWQGLTYHSGSWQTRPNSRSSSKPALTQGSWQTRPSSRGSSKTMLSPGGQYSRLSGRSNKPMLAQGVKMPGLAPSTMHIRAGKSNFAGVRLPGVVSMPCLVARSILGACHDRDLCKESPSRTKRAASVDLEARWPVVKDQAMSPSTAGRFHRHARAQLGRSLLRRQREEPLLRVLSLPTMNHEKVASPQPQPLGMRFAEQERAGIWKTSVTESLPSPMRFRSTSRTRGQEPQKQSLAHSKRMLSSADAGNNSFHLCVLRPGSRGDKKVEGSLLPCLLTGNGTLLSEASCGGTPSLRRKLMV
eukprot:TRINITY_DN29285_c0_g1_i1.p1 TRINITY_DN29285_c0_g1~~TRINITY_DN29285_c0_g1_i1.p1  ORF type:complete len:872 (+),score=156.51 TRINITY_DN29285_c0_g1_i1:324-2618(+)